MQITLHYGIRATKFTPIRLLCAIGGSLILVTKFLWGLSMNRADTGRRFLDQESARKLRTGGQTLITIPLQRFQRTHALRRSITSPTRENTWSMGGHGEVVVADGVETLGDHFDPLKHQERPVAIRKPPSYALESLVWIRKILTQWGGIVEKT